MITVNVRDATGWRVANSTDSLLIYSTNNSKMSFGEQADIFVVKQRIALHHGRATFKCADRYAGG